MANRFLEPDLATEWGLRTLGSHERRYNPISYHNGSIWPHDNSLIGFGLYRSGNPAVGHVVSRALISAAATMPLQRLPELYCGFARETIAFNRPIDYPVSCSPQAWAAGALPMLIWGMLGLSVDPVRRVLVAAPSLPDWLDNVAVANLRVLGQTGTLTVRRTTNDVEIQAKDLPLVTN